MCFLFVTVSDYIDYNVDDSYDDTTYAIAAPVYHGSYGGGGHGGYGGGGHGGGGHGGYGGGGHGGYGGGGQGGYGHTQYHTTYHAVPVPDYDYDDYEYESFGSKIAKGWKAAKEQVFKWEEEATKKIKDFCRFLFIWSIYEKKVY